MSDTPVTFRFGDSEALCDELLALVRSGRKTATSGMSSYPASNAARASQVAVLRPLRTSASSSSQSASLSPVTFRFG
ncbi:MAG: hypothetical protein AAFX10_15840, partial [Pseudomonadota bacterium]